MPNIEAVHKWIEKHWRFTVLIIIIAGGSIAGSMFRISTSDTVEPPEEFNVPEIQVHVSDPNASATLRVVSSVLNVGAGSLGERASDFDLISIDLQIAGVVPTENVRWILGVRHPIGSAESVPSDIDPAKIGEPLQTEAVIPGLFRTVFWSCCPDGITTVWTGDTASLAAINSCPSGILNLVCGAELGALAKVFVPPIGVINSAGLAVRLPQVGNDRSTLDIDFSNGSLVPKYVDYERLLSTVSEDQDRLTRYYSPGNLSIENRLTTTGQEISSWQSATLYPSSAEVDDGEISWRSNGNSSPLIVATNPLYVHRKSTYDFTLDSLSRPAPRR